MAMPVVGEIAGGVKVRYGGIAELGVKCMALQWVAVCWVYKWCIVESMVGESMAGVYDDQTPLAKN